MPRGNPFTSFLTRALLLAVTAALCLTQAASAGGIRISAPASTHGEVIDYQIASTGAYAVYKTTLEDRPYLYSVSLEGGGPIGLATTLPPGDHFFTQYDITPDGSRVIYAAYQESTSYRSLYTTPIQAKDAIRLSPASQNVDFFVLSPDSQWVIFSTWVNFIHYLYRAPADGSSPAQEIVIPGATRLRVDSLSISPNNQYLVFLGHKTGATDWAVYSLPLTGDGSQAQRLTRALAATYSILYKVSPDSQYLVYQHIQDTAGHDQRIYSVPLAGPAADEQLISGPTLSGDLTGYRVKTFQISPDNRRVVFVADREVAGKFELYSTSLARRTDADGGPIPPTPVRLNVAISNTRDVDHFTLAISPDSSRVAYSAEQSNPHDLFSVPIDGPIAANQPLNQPKNPTVYFSWMDTILFTPDSSRIIFTAMHTPDLVELFSVPADGSFANAVKLNLPIQKNTFGWGRVQSPLISQTGGSVFYVAEALTTRQDLFEVPSGGPAGASRNLTGVPADGTATTAPCWVPGRNQIVYIQSSPGNGQELFLIAFGAQIFLPAVIK